MLADIHPQAMQMNPKYMCFTRKKDTALFKSYDYFQDIFLNGDLRREFFHFMTQPQIASIDQGKIYLQRFFKYKHKIAHLYIIFFFTKMNIEIINMVQHNTTSMS